MHVEAMPESQAIQMAIAEERAHRDEAIRVAVHQALAEERARRDTLDHGETERVQDARTELKETMMAIRASHEVIDARLEVVERDAVARIDEAVQPKLEEMTSSFLASCRNVCNDELQRFRKAMESDVFQ